MANIAIDCRRRLVWDGRNERFVGDEAPGDDVTLIVVKVL